MKYSNEHVKIYGIFSINLLNIKFIFEYHFAYRYLYTKVPLFSHETIIFTGRIIFYLCNNEVYKGIFQLYNSTRDPGLHIIFLEFSV